MAFFALIRDTGEPSYEILDCHLNLWALRGIGRHVLFLDVGLMIRAADALSVLNVALPFGTHERSLRDISAHILNPRVAELIFGNPIEIDGKSSTIDYGSGEARVGQIAENDAKRVAERSGRGHSYWTVPLARSAHDEAIYVRFRFEITSVGREWTRRHVPLLSDSLLADLRVGDVREASGVTRWDALKDLIVPIKNLYAFVIVPAHLQLQATSPALRYMRLLESPAWEPYLGRRTGRFASPRFIVYYWRHQSTGPSDLVDQIKPFRAFLSLRSQPGLSAGSTVQTALVVFVAVLVARWTGDPLKTFGSDVSEFVTDWFRVLALSALGLIVGGAVLAWVPVTRSLWHRARSLISIIDAFWYGRV